MKQKTLIVLVAASALTAAVAAVTLTQRDAVVVKGSDEVGASEEAFLFPGLLDKLNDVKTVTVKRKDGEATLIQSPSGWGLAEKSGFPVEKEPVRKMLLGMGQMKKVEAKTSDASRYAQLGVQEPDAEGSKSALITLKDAGGKEVAQLVLGKEHDSKGAALMNQRYVRVPGNPQTWLVQGTFDVREKATDWLDKKILELKRDRVRSIEITQPDGELLAVDRPDAKTTEFKVLEIPEGKELTYPTAATGVAGGLEFVTIEDVEPVEKVDFTTGVGPVAKYTLFDGVVVTVTMKDQDGKTWAKFAASYEAPPPDPAPAATDATPPVDPANPDAPKPDTTTPPRKSPEEAAREVADLNERFSKWAYVVSSYTRANVGKKKSELLKDKPPPPAPVDPNAPLDPNAPKQGALVLPETIPLEIQEQIKAHQDKVGGKVEINPNTPATPPEVPGPKTEAPPPKPDLPKPDGPQPKPDDHPPH